MGGVPLPRSFELLQVLPALQGAPFASGALGPSLFVVRQELGMDSDENSDSDSDTSSVHSVGLVGKDTVEQSNKFTSQELKWADVLLGNGRMTVRGDSQDGFSDGYLSKLAEGFEGLLGPTGSWGTTDRDEMS